MRPRTNKAGNGTGMGMGSQPTHPRLLLKLKQRPRSPRKVTLPRILPAVVDAHIPMEGRDVGSEPPPPTTTTINTIASSNSNNTPQVQLRDLSREHLGARGLAGHGAELAEQEVDVGRGGGGGAGVGAPGEGRGREVRHHGAEVGHTSEFAGEHGFAVGAVGCLFLH